MWNLQTRLRTYGKRKKINLNIVKLVLIVGCIATPATNWLIPFIHKKVGGSCYV